MINNEKLAEEIFIDIEKKIILKSIINKDIDKKNVYLLLINLINKNMYDIWDEDK